MIRAVIFDLDGTITKPFLDFGKIRAEIGMTTRVALLEAISVMSAGAREAAEAILRRHEIEAAVNAEINEGLDQVLSFLEQHDLRSGIITRNCEESTSLILTKLGLKFDAVITRDAGLLPKPSPEPLLFLCRKWGIEPGQAVMVGDHDFDVQTGKAAGALTVFLTNGADKGSEADFTITQAGELLSILRRMIDA